MTIQLSVSLWTIICFVLLMLILHNLLFKPVLKVMDSRKEHIKNAADKKAEIEKKESERSFEIAQMRAAAYEAQKKKVKQELEAVRANSKKEIEDAIKERFRALDESHIRADEERGEILGELSSHSAELAALFADSLLR